MRGTRHGPDRRLRTGGLRVAVVAALAALAGACGEPGENFSQHPGFADFYARYPPSPDPPGEADRALLRRFRPRVFLPAGHEGPIDFYRDYVAEGVLLDGDGEIVSTAVTPAILNARKADPAAEFRHRPTGRAPTPTVYGRIDRDRVRFPTPAGPVERRFTFLTYTLVFRVSGLPAGMSRWQRLAVSLIGDPRDWHQLDHYTAFTLALDEALRPVAVTFQHHNYLHTRLIGRDLPWPADDRIAVDVAIGSNELYPHREGRVRRRAASFLTAESARYLITGEGRPLTAADDITDPAREIDYALAFLAPADAFYTFQGYLGERRRGPGRHGPPGADYNTVPAFKPRGRQMLAYFWRAGNAADLERLRARFRGEGGFLDAQAAAFWRAWRCGEAGAAGGNC